MRDIVRDGVETLGFELGPIDLVPEDATETDFTFNGPARVLLTGILRPHGVEWYEEDGAVRFSRIGKSDDDRPDGIVVSEQTRH